MDGIIIINKPKNNTSHDIVKKVKKLLNEKVGHTGTLDPNATGVLPLLIGKGTELSKYLINHNKTYEAILQLGEKRDTGDSEGKIIEEKKVIEIYLNRTNVENVFKNFIGEQEQIPPMYSAIKVNGKKLYEYARKGEKVEIQPRKIQIYSLELLNLDNQKKQIEFRVKCSKGTYIRTLCEEIAYRLQTVGYMKELKRTEVGEFNIKDSITIEELENIIKNNNLKKDNIKNNINNFISIENYFKNNEIIELNENKLRLFLNGVKLTFNLVDGIYKIYFNENFIGTGIVNDKLLKRDIIL